jgi:hypothetical protein
MKFLKALLLTLTLVVGGVGQNITVTPTTTVTALTSNNTSASDSFKGTSNGNIGASNISKENLHKLLYAGSTTQIYAHYMPWWGQPGHINIGLNENLPAVVNAQVADAMSRGIDGFIVDWYGKPVNNGSTFINTSTVNVREAAEATAQFKYAICWDSGALKNSTASDTSKLLTDLSYASTTFFNSPQYLRVNGRPVVFLFLNGSNTIDFSYVASHAAGNPIFVNRNSSGFSKPSSGGAYSWVGVANNTTDEGLDYLKYFYANALKNMSKVVFGSNYKGFDDSIASWGQNRFTKQSKGDTFLDSMAVANDYFNETKQLPFLQIATWNDYEEGTEIETGVDAGLQVSATVTAAGNLSWTTTGSLSGLDHYVLYISTDGQNLMKLDTFDATATSAELSTYSLTPGTPYYFFVQAVAKPTLKNDLSSASMYTHPVPPPPPPVVHTVSVANPVDGSTVSHSTSFKFQASTNYTPDRLEFWLDGVKMTQVVATSTLTYTVTLTKTGSHRLVAQAVKGSETLKAIVYVNSQ